MLGAFLSTFKNSALLSTFWHAAGTLAPVWVPLTAVLIWWSLWIQYKRSDYIKEQGSMLLEIKIPREMNKSPQAMEMFLANLYQTGVGSLIDVYYKGRVRPWYSLELVSIDGVVHFYIWTWPKFRGVIEAQLYANFPNIEVHEAPDYSLSVHHNPSKINFGWIGQFKLTKADAYPIKTYIDYGLDQDPKEEYKNDPIVSVLEFLGSLKKGEQAWIQIMVRAHAKETLKFGRIVAKPDWKDDVKNEIKDYIKKNSPAKEDKAKDATVRDLTKTQQDVVAAIERSVGKNAFDTMIRATYFAEKDIFDSNNIGGLLGSFKQFSSNTLNGIAPDFKAGYDYPWQDFKERRKMGEQRELLEAYKRRSFFYTPFKNHKGKPFILTAEELATMFHFPSSEVAATPTLTRIPSKKSEAPSNLPI